MDVWIVYTFWLLRIGVYEHSCTMLCEHMFSSLLSGQLEGELLYIEYICVSLSKKLLKCFPKQLHHFIVLAAKYEGSGFSMSLRLLSIVRLLRYILPRNFLKNLRMPGLQPKPVKSDCWEQGPRHRYSKHNKAKQKPPCLKSHY